MDEDFLNFAFRHLDELGPVPDSIRQMLREMSPEDMVAFLRANAAGDPQAMSVLSIWDKAQPQIPFVQANRDEMESQSVVPNMHQALEISEQIGFETLQVLASKGLQDTELGAINTLAIGCAKYVKGEFQQAAGYLEHALDVRRKLEGVKGEGYLKALFHWARAHLALGRGEKVISRIEECLAPPEPAECPSLDDLRSMLGSHYLQRNLYDRARPILEAALDRSIRGSGLSSTPAVEALTRLAQLEIRSGNTAAADAMRRRAQNALGGRRGVLWADIARYSLALLAADVAAANADGATEASFVQDALSIARLFQVPRDVRVAECLIRLAGIFDDLGQSDRAVEALAPLLQDPDGLDCLGATQKRQALTLLLRGHPHLGNEFPLPALAHQWIQAWAQETRQAFGYVGEDGLLQITQSFWRALREYFAFLSQLTVEHGEQEVFPLWRDAYCLVLEFKASVADSLCISRERRLAALYPEHRDDLERLVDLRRQLQGAFREVFQGLPQSEIEQIANGMKIEKENLEDRLRQAIPAMDRSEQSVSLEAVAAGLLTFGKDCVLIDFVRIEDSANSWFLAFLLPAGRPDSLRVVHLEDAPAIAKSIEDLRQQLRAEFEGGLGPETVDYAPTWHRIWAPIEEALNAAHSELGVPPDSQSKRVLICPDGTLSTLPFQVLRNPNWTDETQHLVDSYEITYCSAVKDLNSIGESKTFMGSRPLVIGLSEFDGHSGTSQPERRSAHLHKFATLDYAEVEAADVGSLIKAEVWTSKSSVPITKRRLLDRLGHIDSASPADWRSPAILHIASHGFSFPLTTEGSTDDVMTLSGLALAGADDWLAGGMQNDDHDGILTAREISGLDLRETQLVVLSACDTGLGSVASGEGVFGLQRAFRIAGAGTLLMAMWTVNDGIVSEVMGRFYSNLLTRMTPSAALRELQRKFKSGDLRFPFLWGALICQGGAESAQIGTMSYR